MGYPMSIISLDSELERELEKVNATAAKQATEFMAYYAALYILSGGGTWYYDGYGVADSDELKDVAKQLKDLGMADYAAQCYGSTEEEVDRLRFEGFLLQNIDKLKLPEGCKADVSELKTQLREKIAERGMTCGEYALQNMKKQKDGREHKPYSEKDRAVYEYELSDRDWQLAASAAWMSMGQGGKPLAEASAQSAKKNVFSRMCLRNKQTVEKIHRGEVDLFAEEFGKTKASFTFKDPQTLEKAQRLSTLVLNNMREMQGPHADSPQWQNLLTAAEEFTTADSLEKASKKSANLLLAIEAFTKGKKSKYNDEATQEMVNASLSLLSTSIPDGPRNPNVKPLINRFNDVRAHRLQSRVELEDHGLNSALEMLEGEEKIKISKNPVPEKDPDRKISPVANELYG